MFARGRAGRARGAILCALGVLLAWETWGLINPNFTPVHLTEQSQVILEARAKIEGQVGEVVELEVVRGLKGEAPKKITIDLSRAEDRQVAPVKRVLRTISGQPVLFFAGRYEEADAVGEEESGLVHVGGMWLRLRRGPGGAWEFHELDELMDGTWNGGTDMLLRCVEYILAGGGAASVPCDEGTNWRGAGPAGRLPGRASALHVVPLGADGSVALHAASAKGDRLFVPVEGKDALEDATTRYGLESKSVASVWGDFNGDGRIDLASVSELEGGRVLTLWARNASKRFAPAATSDSLPADCSGLAAVGIGEGRLAVVAGGSSPALLVFEGGSLRARPLAPGVRPPAEWGKPRSLLSADFTGDGLPDLIQTFEAGGWLFVGRRPGEFAPPSPCGVGAAGGGGSADVGDFDGDGLLDVLAAGREGLRIFQNDGDGTFTESFALSGEVSYKAQAFASGCSAGDFNNDGRQDIVVTYGHEQALLYYNRGFRSFAEAREDLEPTLKELVPDEAFGQDAGVLADVDGDGAQDLVLVLGDGRVWCAYNDLGGEGLCIKAHLSMKSPFPGPVTVTAWREERLLGAWSVRAGAGPAFIGVEEPGPYRLKWRFPGGGRVEHTVIVEEEPVSVFLDKPGREGR